jgi:hypothetical protein
LTFFRSKSGNTIIHGCGKNKADQVPVMVKLEEPKDKMLTFSFRETNGFSPKSVVKLKNEHKHILNNL